MNSVLARSLFAAGLCAVSASAAAQGVIERPRPYAGEVLTTKGGEELQLKAAADWRTLYANQDVIGGDTIRTNDAGGVAILFEDRTQIRVGRNSTLVVKDIARSPTGETQLSLERGSIWARAARGGAGVKVDTPAAAAAIRGTDWTLRTEGKKTSLLVLDGEVELANPQGSITVRRGEGGEAVVGQPPRKISVVNIDKREQILIYRDLSDSFSELTPTDMTRREERAARAAALARPEAARSAQDWLVLAETGLTYDGPKAAERALEQAERMRLAPRERARADLARCFVDARARRFAKAAALCQAAAPRLDPKRRATAAYLAWAARRQAEPGKAEKPPSPTLYGDQPTGVLARASVEAFLSGPKTAIGIIDQNLARYPDDVMMRAGRALLFIMAGDKDAAKAAIDDALRVDPDDPYALVASARYKYVVQSDLEGALKDLKRAQVVAPGADFVWLETSLVQGERDATHEAEAAHLKAIELDPNDPLNRSNYAVFLIDNGRLGEAEAELKASEALDPGGFFNLYTRGFLLVTQGKTEEGIEKLLAASAISPDASGVQIALGIANYQSGNLVEAVQAFDNADQFDDDDPLTPLIRSVIAVDQYQSDEAIINARESLRRRQARGGDFATIDANRQNGSFVASAMRFQGLDEWGRYYGDRVADAFTSSAYFDQAIVSAANPFEAIGERVAPGELNVAPSAFSSLVQGLLIDPLAAAGSERRTTIVYHPFAEAAAEGGLVKQGKSYGWQSNTTLQAVAMQPFPVSIYADATFERPDSPLKNDKADSATGVVLLGAKPTPYDNLSFFNVVSKDKTGGRLFDKAFDFLPPNPTPDNERTLVSFTGAAWAHEFSERNVLQAMVAGTTFDQKTTTGSPFFFDQAPGDGVIDGVIGLDNIAKLRQREVSYGVSHLLGVGDVTLRTGAEGAHARYHVEDVTRNLDGSALAPSDTRLPGDAWRAYADATWDVTRDIKVQGGLYGSSVRIGEEGGDNRYEPRIGVAWQPIDGQWLRAAYRRDTVVSNVLTLSPITTVGITPAQIPLSFGGRTKTLAGRWDAEWSKHLFTALEYQRQRVQKLSLDIPESYESLDVENADIDRLTATANVWLTHGLGAFASYTRSWSKVKDQSLTYFASVEPGDDVPFLPKHSGRVGLTYVHPSMVKVTVAQNLVGNRIDALGQKLDRFTTTDATATWELFDKRLALSLEALNIFDNRVEFFGSQRRIPFPPFPAVEEGALLGAGRTITASARLRF